MAASSLPQPQPVFATVCLRSPHRWQTTTSTSSCSEGGLECGGCVAGRGPGVVGAAAAGDLQAPPPLGAGATRRRDSATAAARQDQAPSSSGAGAGVAGGRAREEGQRRRRRQHGPRQLAGVPPVSPGLSPLHHRALLVSPPVANHHQHTKLQWGRGSNVAAGMAGPKTTHCQISPCRDPSKRRGRRETGTAGPME
ncbi:hypothetical protein OsJ_06273 [Oryza sativa Japonica Group]|uniref:Uncharacterized protein n=1 Tax=Oryza sativa subsp. japonica TaxID=39947 RepID=B9F515_ORYSJ|nr:hypothetical protein OsJ_06273 [Oryza sativa Japonica Group]